MAGPLARFGAVGDIHCEDALLAAALDHLAVQRLDHVLAVGDIADGRGDVNRCCELLERHGVTAVAGNHDRWLLTEQARDLPEATQLAGVSERTRLFLTQLPRSVRFDTIAGPLLLCHGLGDNDMAKISPDDYGYALESNYELQNLIRSDHSLVLCGHTHRRMVRSFGALTIVNAGTLRSADTPCFVVLDLDGRFAQFFDLAVDGTVTEAERLSFA